MNESPTCQASLRATRHKGVFSIAFGIWNLVKVARHGVGQPLRLRGALSPASAA